MVILFLLAFPGLDLIALKIVKLCEDLLPLVFDGCQIAGLSVEGVMVKDLSDVGSLMLRGDVRHACLGLKLLLDLLWVSIRILRLTRMCVSCNWLWRAGMNVVDDDRLLGLLLIRIVQGWLLMVLREHRKRVCSIL